MFKQKTLPIVALCACIFALCVIGLGAFTRLMDAGLGCPDWPQCYGHWVVTSIQDTHLNVYKAWAEMVHRYFAGALGAFIIATVCLLFCKPWRSKSNILLGVGLVALLVYQILLGQWTVTYKLMPIVVTQHLMGGFLILVFLWLIYLNNNRFPLLTSPFYLRIGAIFALGLLLIQIFLGAWTSTNYAAFSCPGFPWCVDNVTPMHWDFSEAFKISTSNHVNYEGGVLSEYARQTIQMMHRAVAGIFVFYFFILTLLIMINHTISLQSKKIVSIIWLLIFIQVSLGITNILFKLPLLTAVLHNLVAILLLLSIVTLVYRIGVRNVK